MPSAMMRGEYFISKKIVVFLAPILLYKFYLMDFGSQKTTHGKRPRRLESQEKLHGVDNSVPPDAKILPPCTRIAFSEAATCWRTQRNGNI
jgi:hypothetical protein